jgi:hypothetical protein
MRRPVWGGLAAFAILFGHTVSGADALKPAPSKPTFDPAKAGIPGSSRIDKQKLMINKPQGGPDPDFGPPSGAILDLNGTASTVAFQQHTVNFTATLSSTVITFAIRSDPGAIWIEEVSVTDLAGGGNLLTNGDFSGGAHTSNGNTETPVGWTWTNPNGAVDTGILTTGFTGPQPNGDAWEDPSVYAYDLLSQTISTIPGHTYHISFYLTHDAAGTFCITTAACGNAYDALVYAQGATTGGSVPAVPTSGLWMMALLLLAAGLVQLRRGLLAR